MSRIRPKRRTPRRRDAPQEDAAWWETATLALLSRCHGLCESCGLPLRGQLERHHRQRRRVGGDRLSNLLALHPACHQWVTEHPAEAMERGLIVSSYATDPAEVPVTPDPFGPSWLLDDDGGRTPYP